MRNQNAMADILTYKGMPGVKATLAALMPLAMPAIIEQVMITMVQYVDTAMVGALGSVATAAVGLTASSTWLIGGLLGAAAVGFSVQVAHFVGADRQDEARDVVGQAVKFILVFGLMLGAISVAISGALPHWLGADEAVYPLAVSYFRIIAFAVPFNFCAQMLGSILRCAGDTRTPMRLNLSINVLNIIFNFLLIYPTRVISVFGLDMTMWGADMGVTGAAVGSFCSMVIVSGLYLLILFRRESPIRQHLRDKRRFTKPVLSAAWRLGVPVALERSLTCVAQIVITAIISQIGTVAIAANHLAVTAESLSYMPAYGLAAAGTTMIGQAMGAGRKDLARRFSRIITYMGILIMTIGGALLFLLAPELIRLFSSEDAVIALGTDVLRIVAFAEPCFAMSIVITGVLRGAGDTRGPFLISLVTMWGVRITLSLLLFRSLGLVGVWVAMAVELCVRGILFMIRMYRDKWLNYMVV